jgi:hypothetical protein
MNAQDGDTTSNQTSSGSIPDEDLEEGAVTDPNVLAEVKLPTRPSTPSSLSILSFINFPTTRIQMVNRKHC